MKGKRRMKKEGYDVNLREGVVAVLEAERGGGRMVVMEEVVADK